MTPNDLKFRNDYVDVDSFRLKLVDSFMHKPLDVVLFNNSISQDFNKAILSSTLDLIPSLLTYLEAESIHDLSPNPRTKDFTIDLEDNRFLRHYSKASRNLPVALRNSLCYLFEGLYLADSLTSEAFIDLTNEEKDFIKNNFPVIILEDVSDEFKTPEELDQEIKYEEELAKEMIPYLEKIKREKIYEAGIALSSATKTTLSLLKDYLKTQPQLKIPPKAGIKSITKDKKDQENDIIFRLNTFLGEIIIGGFGSTKYQGTPVVIIDLGGDDLYSLSTTEDDSINSSVIIDLTGDDIYRSEGDFVIGSGFFGSGILVDVFGNDTYLTDNFSLGSGLFGVGMLVDEGGDDRYFGDTFTMGAGSFGLGILVDIGGVDQYTASLFAQGVGFVSGFGALIDSSGNDNYFAGGKYKDILRYKDHYVSESQGFAIGLGPIMSGGIGLLYDLSGNDLYTSDIFGQGSSYWWALGSLVDEAGNDKYVSFQYAQGAGTHLTLGILEDESGDDIYISKGVSQGCGHDLALGFLYDKSGNDDYIACDLSQGAGSANGIGILIDEDGDDGYYVEKKHNTQGYGNPRRDYGSIGIFLDLSGNDHYDGNGKDSTWWTIPSKWGVGIDK
ncbi:MAG: hypothetical protein KAX39_03050 [candidate division Zixibacteria bacterium]|nr:hypothetical protein [candidate division Zixibacteria bacterium]